MFLPLNTSKKSVVCLTISCTLWGLVGGVCYGICQTSRFELNGWDVKLEEGQAQSLTYSNRQGQWSVSAKLLKLDRGQLIVNFVHVNRDLTDGPEAKHLFQKAHQMGFNQIILDVSEEFYHAINESGSLSGNYREAERIDPYLSHDKIHEALLVAGFKFETKTVRADSRAEVLNYRITYVRS